MANMPVKIATRIASGLKKFQPIVESAKSRDVNETDTVVVITDMLHDVFGFDKYTEITTEHNIKGTYVDLAVKFDDKVQFLIEVKAVGLDLKDAYVKQAIDYGANLGVDWVILTTGVLWRVYKIQFAKPIDFEVVYEFNLLELNPKDDDDLENIWMLTKEGWAKEGLKDFHTQKQTLNRFVLAALIRSESVVKVIQRELKRIAPGVRISHEEVENALCIEVLKREAIEGEKADAARKIVSRASNKPLRVSKSNDDDETDTDEENNTDKASDKPNEKSSST
jgi:hypothetical protein